MIDNIINCDANNPGFEHLTEKQIVGGALEKIASHNSIYKKYKINPGKIPPNWHKSLNI